MIRHSASGGIPIGQVAAATPHPAALRQPVTASIQVDAGQPAAPQHAVPVYETFLCSLSFVLAAIVVLAELIRMSGEQARQRAGAQS